MLLFFIFDFGVDFVVVCMDVGCLDGCWVKWWCVV